MRATIKTVCVSAQTGIPVGYLLQVGGRIHRVGTIVPADCGETARLDGNFPVRFRWVQRGKKAPVPSVYPPDLKGGTLKLLGVA